MTYAEIQQALADLESATAEREDLYIEGEGEETQQTIDLTRSIESLKVLLGSDGVDSLGRWLKAKEDAAKSLYAEKKAAESRYKKATDDIEWLKGKIGEVLRKAGMEKAKGTYYSFTATATTETKCDNARIQQDYGLIAANAAVAAGVPAWVDVKLSSKKSNFEEGAELPDYFSTSTGESCRFGKPRQPRDAEEFQPIDL